MKKENKQEKLNVNDFWKLSGNKVIHCKSTDESKILLEVFRRMESAEKVSFSKYGYTYMKHNMDTEGERCFDNLEHDFELDYYKNHTSYTIYEFSDVDLTEYLTKEELKEYKKLMKKDSGVNLPEKGE